MSRRRRIVRSWLLGQGLRCRPARLRSCLRISRARRAFCVRTSRRTPTCSNGNEHSSARRFGAASSSDLRAMRSSPRSPVRRTQCSAAGEAQRLLTSEAWPDGACLRVRMGIHTGTPRVVADDYVGLDVHRTARVCAAAHGAQVITSQSTRDLLTDCDLGVGFLDLGRHTLKDFEEPRRRISCGSLGAQRPFHRRAPGGGPHRCPAP